MNIGDKVTLEGWSGEYTVIEGPLDAYKVQFEPYDGTPYQPLLVAGDRMRPVMRRPKFAIGDNVRVSVNNVIVRVVGIDADPAWEGEEIVYKLSPGGWGYKEEDLRPL